MWIETQKNNFYNLDTGAKVERFIENDAEVLKLNVGSSKHTFSGEDAENVKWSIRAEIMMRKQRNIMTATEFDFYESQQNALKILGA